MYVIKHDLTNIFYHSNPDRCIVYAHQLIYMFIYLYHFFSICLCFFYAPIRSINIQYAKQLLLSFLFMHLPRNDAMRFNHQRKPIAISNNDVGRNHQGNSINRIIGQHESFVQYANVKQCGILIQFTVYVAKEKCTEAALYYLLMNSSWLETIHICTVGYVTNIYFHSFTFKAI